MNINKNLKRNLGLPINNRLGLSDVTRKISVGKSYAAKLALLALIHSEVAPLKVDKFEFGTRGLQNQGYTNSRESLLGYQKSYGMDGQPMEDLGHANEPRFAIIQQSANIAEAAKEKAIFGNRYSEQVLASE